jgi:diguanylate cyclase (GGDEF)-like protein/putative nucleotidyltransferase with HDIG domain
MEGILRSIIAAGYRTLQGSGLVLFRYDPLSDSFPDEWRLVESEILRRYSTQVSHKGMTAQILRSGEPLVVNDVAQFHRASPYMPGDVRCFIGAPVVSDGVPWGVLYVSESTPDAFDDGDVEFVLALSRQIGAAVHASSAGNGSSVELSTVRVLAATVDAKDHYTRYHSTNVAFYARLMAREMNLDPAEVRRIDLTGLLHDIGKIAIPDQILQKPGPLTSEEWLLVQAHASIGANILAQASHLQHLVPLVRHHHERYDGKGYPDGMKGDEIPLGAMIINLADSFDTMTTHRVYRSPLTLDAAMAEVRRCAGTQFHPEVARAMENLVARAVANGDPWVRSLGGVQDTARSGIPDEMAWQSLLSPSPTAGGQHRDPLDFLVEARLFQHSTDLLTLLERAGAQALDFWSADAVQIYLVNPDTCTLQLAWADGTSVAQPFMTACRKEGGRPMTHGLIGWSALANQGLTIPDARRDPRWPYAAEFDGPVSVLVAPIGTGSAPSGVVQMVVQGESRFGTSDVQVMKVFTSLLGQAIEHVQHRAETMDAFSMDSLTGVRNSNYLRVLLEHLEREPWGHALSVAFLDGDDLKDINDRFGHEAGDQVIRHIARSLQAWRRPEDVVVRFAGDEFLIFFGGLSLPEASARLERIRMTISETPVELPGGKREYVSVSCGVTDVDTSLGPHQAVRAAEQAMYNAKRTGKNRIWTAAG